MQYNKKCFLEPDPLQFLWRYNTLEDREICGLIASSLAYGRVAQIIANLEKLFQIIGSSPRDFLEANSYNFFKDKFSGFKHRFTTGEEIAKLFSNAKLAIEKYRTIGAALENFVKKSSSYLEALEEFAQMLNGESSKANYLIPRPSSGSACKRLNLYIKWMSRKDEIDPGGWNISPSELIIPLDTHMWQIGKYLRFTERKTPDLKAALEISSAFRKINPEDPCKYDFALTRLGIRNTKKIQNSKSLVTDNEN